MVRDIPDPDVASGFEFGFESEQLDRNQLKDMILQEVGRLSKVAFFLYTK